MKSASLYRVNETKMTKTSGVRVLWRSLAGATLMLLMLCGGAGAALAHDSVEGTLPVDGSTVATAPAKVTITLSGDPSANYSEIVVADAAGVSWSMGSVQVLDNVATQEVKPGAPAGKYTVTWRLVSADGHPIDGNFAFTATAASSGSGAVAGTLQSVQTVTEAATSKVPDSSTIPWSIFALFGVLIVVVIAMVVTAKRRLGAPEE